MINALIFFALLMILHYSLTILNINANALSLIFFINANTLVSIKFFRRGTWMVIIAKYSEGGSALGGISNRQNMLRIGQKIVQMLIKSKI